jgi:DNA-binding transcriptional LysR family regulator
MTYFVAVAEELHFGRAAERLHLAGPSLSQQISNLERELGTQLLVRDRRHVELTPAGSQFLTDAREVLAAAERAFDRARKGAGSYLCDWAMSVGFPQRQHQCPPLGSASTNGSYRHTRKRREWPKAGLI